MAAGRDLLNRLADAGEDAIGRLADAPGGDRMLGAFNSLRDRVDELQRRVRGIDALERRLTELEARVEGLSGAREGSLPQRVITPAGTAAGSAETPPEADVTPGL